MNTASGAKFSFCVYWCVCVPVERSIGSASLVGPGAGVGGTVDPSGKTMISTCLGPIQT